MDLLPTEEQEEIISSVSTFLANEYPLDSLPALDGSDRVVDAAKWQQCADLGWFGLGLSEEAGGVGYTLAEEALLFREIGRGLAPGPFLATVLGAHLAAESNDSELVTSIVGGGVRVGLAEPHLDHGGEVADTIKGRYHVTHHADADFVLFVGSDAAALVAASELGDVEPVPSLDPVVPVALVEIDRAAASVLAADSQQFRLRGAVLTAAMLSGIAEATAAQSVSYASDRQQFGQPIGSFQAVKHRCADMAVNYEAATSQMFYAALALRDGLPDAAFQAHTAKIIAGRSAIHNAEINVQNHGGMGFTWEHTAHRFVTRARVWDMAFGSYRSHQPALLAEPAAQ